MSARAEVLARVRAALGPKSAVSMPAATDQAPGPSPLDHPAALARLEERLREFGSRVHRATDATVAATIGTACTAHGAREVIVPEDWPEPWTPAGVEVTRDAGFDARRLSAFDAAVTGARLAIAESGTIAFDHGRRQGRRHLSLLPELHVCVLRADDVVDSIVAAMARLRPSNGAHGPLTFVTGPSATTDIELTRIEGVHGPRALVVVLVDGE